MKDLHSWGVVVARFQTPRLTDGHRKLLNYVASKHTNLLIVLGVRPATPSDVNPLPYTIRRDMVLSSYPDAVVVPMADMSDDKEWSRTLDKLVRISTSNAHATFYTGRGGFDSHYHGYISVEHVQLDIPPEVNATSLRTTVHPNDYAHSVIVEEAFRAGMMYTHNMLPPSVHMTVDMAILHPDGDKVLLGRKPHEHAFRFPGGMFDPGKDKTFKHAASREAWEETSVNVELSTWVSLGDFEIGDWRSRDTDQHFWHTLFFVAQLPWSNISKAGDDLVEVKWVPVDSGIAGTLSIVEEHMPLWKALEIHLEEGVDHATE